MIRYLTEGFKRAFGLHRPGRKLPVLHDDILIASYPRSGNTWLRLLIANLLQPANRVDLRSLHKLIIDPDLSVKRDIDRMSRPRLVKSNGSFDPRYRRVIYLVRDPRNVVTSQFRCARGYKRGRESLQHFMEQFVSGNLDHYSGSWGENVGSWLATRSRHSGFLLVRYEDLVDDTARELARAAAFAGIAATSERIARAIERSSIVEEPPRNPDDFEGTVAASPSIVAGIEVAWGDKMSYLGYELVSPDTQSILKDSLFGLLSSDSGKRETAKQGFASSFYQQSSPARGKM